MHVDKEVIDGIFLYVGPSNWEFPLGFALHLFLNFLDFIYDLPDRRLIHRPHYPVLAGRHRPVVRIGHLHQPHLTLQVPLQVYLSLVKFGKV